MKKTYYFLLICICVIQISCTKENAGSDNNADPLLEGLIAYYPFNNNANDESGNNYNLVNNGASLTSNRFNKPNSAFSFNGTSDFMIIPGLNKADSLREYSISVWVKPTSLTNSSIVSFLHEIDHFCGGYIGFENRPSYFSVFHQIPYSFKYSTCNSAVLKDVIQNPENNWCHIVLIQRYYLDNSYPRYEYIQYFNGKKLSGSSSTYSSAIDKSTFSKGGIVGGYNHGTNYNLNFLLFEGVIDDIRIYDRMISEDEMTKLYTVNE